jgi:hypothetical protein
MAIVHRLMTWWAQCRAAFHIKDAMELARQRHIYAARALHFLRNNLTPAQRDQFDSKGCFDVIGGATGVRYRIWYGYQFNVELLDAGDAATWICFKPSGDVPIGDIVLAQKLALEHFETDALRVARTSSSGLASTHQRVGNELARHSRAYRPTDPR